MRAVEVEIRTTPTASIADSKVADEIMLGQEIFYYLTVLNGKPKRQITNQHWKK